MEVPRDDEGRPRFSVSQFRTYGSGDLTLDEHEQQKGCPRLYRRKYVDKDIPGEERRRPLEFGGVLHKALELMEERDIGPEEALMLAWSPRLDATDWAEALRVLLGYLDRGGPMTRFATLAHELDVTSQLYVDEDFGPVMFRSILDYVGVDLDQPGILHGVDYKSNQAPPSVASVRRDMQMRSYDWQLRQRWGDLVPGSFSPRIVMHLDALRYRDVEVRYTPADAEEWAAWAEAIARKILRDEDGEPHLNSGCSWCPVQHDCPKWLALPQVGRSLSVTRTGMSAEQLHQHRKELALVQKLVEAAVKAIDEQLVDEYRANGDKLRVGDESWSSEEAWANVVDLPRLQRVLGDSFFDALTASKASIERAVKGLDPSTRSLALACVRREAVGTRIKKTTVGGEA